MPTFDDITNSPLPQLAPRSADSHKGDYGRALLIGGSRGMSGAIALAGKATLRSGAGLVTLAVPFEVQHLVASYEPSYMTHGLADDENRFVPHAADEIGKLSESATAVAIGPGLGRSAGITELVQTLHGQIAQPMVVDADALWALAERPETLSHAGGPRILTPHPGEFARLTGQPYDASARPETALKLAARLTTGGRAIVVVLKGYGTVITDGKRVAINSTGNPGMATGGSGDVLTGIITGLLCQGMSPFDGARLGVHVHGLAGDLAASELGQVSLIASDLIDYLPHAFQTIG